MPPYIPPVVRFDQVRAAPIRWLWEPYLARGKLAVLDGGAGVGKSFLTVDLAARLSRGGRLPDGSRRRRTLKRAKKRLVVARQVRCGGRNAWHWSDPAAPPGEVGEGR